LGSFSESGFTTAVCFAPIIGFPIGQFAVNNAFGAELTDEDNFLVVRDLIFNGDPSGYFLFHRLSVQLSINNLTEAFCSGRKNSFEKASALSALILIIIWYKLNFIKSRPRRLCRINLVQLKFKSKSSALKKQRIFCSPLRLVPSQIHSHCPSIIHQQYLSVLLALINKLAKLLYRLYRFI